MKVKHKIHLASQHEVRSLLGVADANIRKIGSELNVQVVARDQTVTLQGAADDVSNATLLLDELLTIVRGGGAVLPHDVDRLLDMHVRPQGAGLGRGFHPPEPEPLEPSFLTAGGERRPRGRRDRQAHRGGTPGGPAYGLREDRGRGRESLNNPSLGRAPAQYLAGSGARSAGVADGYGISARSPGQQEYLNAINEKRLVFGVGPAGTGKTFLAAGRAVEALVNGRVSRIMLVRPAVEAGEKLGYLPGDLREKIDPYLRPLYDALNDLLSPNQVLRYMERGSIEIAPLAYMRGRTINNTFAILDEAQNTTPKQMLMFLTRMGENSQMVVTGDMTQTDLEGGQTSGLRDAIHKLKDVEDIGIIHLTEKDIVRHPLVVKIVKAYEAAQPGHPLFEQVGIEGGGGGGGSHEGEPAAVESRRDERGRERSDAEWADDDLDAREDA